MTIRTQYDGLGDIVSLDTGLDCTVMPDMTRQEFGPESDINNILQRFGVGSFTDRQPLYIDTDYGLDLQQALATLTELKQAHANLPEEIRRDYPTWDRLVAAIEGGQVVLTSEPPPEPSSDKSSATPPPQS